MKFTIERDVFLRAAAQTHSVAETRNTVPIVANALVEADGKQVSLRSTDFDIDVVDRVDARVESPGATTVNAAMLHEIVRKLPDGATIEVQADGVSDRLNISAGRSSFSLATLPKEDFPEIASSEYDSNFSVPAPVLRRLFDKSRAAVSTEETRYYLNGVYMHVADAEGDKTLRCVATDGHRLACIDADLPDGADGMPGVIVPRKTIGELLKLLEDDESSIAVSVSETKVRFATPDVTLTSKVIDGKFPDYSRVIPKQNNQKLEVDASDFARAVDRVSTISSERSRAVKLDIGASRLVLSVNAPDSGNAEEELEASYSGEDLEIGFNARYLVEFANQVEQDNAVLFFNSAGDPILMRDGDDSGAMYVVMPMRV